jgi:hypothetical protein
MYSLLIKNICKNISLTNEKIILLAQLQLNSLAEYGAAIGKIVTINPNFINT